MLLLTAECPVLFVDIWRVLRATHLPEEERFDRKRDVFGLHPKSTSFRCRRQEKQPRGDVGQTWPKVRWPRGQRLSGGPPARLLLLSLGHSTARARASPGPLPPAHSPKAKLEEVRPLSLKPVLFGACVDKAPGTMSGLWGQNALTIGPYRTWLTTKAYTQQKGDLATEALWSGGRADTDWMHAYTDCSAALYTSPGSMHSTFLS